MEAKKCQEHLKCKKEMMRMCTIVTDMFRSPTERGKKNVTCQINHYNFGCKRTTHSNKTGNSKVNSVHGPTCGPD